KRHEVLKIVGVFRRHRDPGERWSGSIRDGDCAFSATVEINVPVLTVLAINTGAIQRLNDVRLMIGVVRSGRLKFLFSFRKFRDDLVDRDPTGLTVDQRSFTTLGVRRCSHNKGKDQERKEQGRQWISALAR